MMEIFSDNRIHSNHSLKTYKTVRFCALVDHNIILSIEVNGDGGEQKICQDINECKNKEQCRYLKKTGLT